MAPSASYLKQKDPAAHIMSQFLQCLFSSNCHVVTCFWNLCFSNSETNPTYKKQEVQFNQNRIVKILATHGAAEEILYKTG